jgi:DNA-binding response OmpR family regulator
VKDLARRKILVVEDNPLIAWDLEVILRRAGCTVVGPCGTISTAFEVCRTDLDAALLDLSVDGEMIAPLADALSEANVPIIFVTGCSARAVPVRHQRHPVVIKPFQAKDILAVLASTVADRSAIGSRQKAAERTSA